MLEETMRKKISMMGAMLLAAAMLCAAPISLDQSGLSLSVDKALACDRQLSAFFTSQEQRRAERPMRHGFALISIAAISALLAAQHRPPLRFRVIGTGLVSSATKVRRIVWSAGCTTREPAAKVSVTPLRAPWRAANTTLRAA